MTNMDFISAMRLSRAAITGIFVAAIGVGTFATHEASAAIVVNAGGIAGNLNFSAGTPVGSGIAIGGFLFDPANVTSGSGDGNCNLFGGKCIQLNPTATTTMTTYPIGGMFNLSGLSFVLDGNPSELGLFNVGVSGSTLVVSADVAGGSCTATATDFCVAKNDWYNISFNGAADGVTELLFDNTGKGNLRIGGISATLVSTVPLPAAAWLLVGGIGALGAASRRRKGASAA